MKATTLIIIIIAIVLIIFTGVLYGRYQINNSSSTPVGSEHAKIQIGNKTLEFDYPIYANWKAFIDTQKLKYYASITEEKPSNHSQHRLCRLFEGS